MLCALYSGNCWLACRSSALPSFVNGSFSASFLVFGAKGLRGEKYVYASWDAALAARLVIKRIAAVLNCLARELGDLWLSGLLDEQAAEWDVRSFEVFWHHPNGLSCTFDHVSSTKLCR